MTGNKTLKLIIDTNLWISFIISNKFNLLDHLLYQRRARILFSSDSLIELSETIQKPKLKKYFGKHTFEEMLTVFEPFIDLIEVKSEVGLSNEII